MVTSLGGDCASACVFMHDNFSRLFVNLLGPSSRMSSQPPTGPSASPGGRTAAWKMDEPQPKRQGQKRPKRPRIDIDEQIEEANRLAALLKKVQQSAKNIKKAGQRTKKRLLAKAGRLSGDDLERISVIKRCGLIVDPRTANGESEESKVPPSFQVAKDTTRGTVTDQLVRIFDGIVTTDRSAAGVVPQASSAQTAGLAQSSAQSPTFSGVLRLAAKARVGSASTCEDKSMPEQASVVVDEVHMGQVNGHEEGAELEEDFDSVADESPEMCNP